MLLGQLYYFDKKLDDLPGELNSDTIARVEILGLESLTSSELSGLSEQEVRRVLRDMFSSSYSLILSENELSFAEQFWNGLSSALVQQEMNLQPSTDFQIKLTNWVESGTRFAEIPELLQEGSLASDETDFALNYGLRVMYILSSAPKQDGKSAIESDNGLVTPHNSADSANLDVEPRIIILTNNQIAPLFVNLNCVFLPLKSDIEIVQSDVEESLITHPNISLILVEGPNNVSIAQYLERKLNANVLVTIINLEHNSDSNQVQQDYFAQIVRDTLGIKLT